MTFQERAAQVMEHLVGHDGDSGHGYSQYSRLGDGGSETVELTDGSTVEVATGDRDCSSAVIDAWEAALPGSTGGATYTGNMRVCFLSTGLWAWHPAGDGYAAQRGDVYLNETHHTAMCKSASPDLLMQFSISENDTVDGAEGDQTGWESNTRAFYDWPWDGKLEYVGPQPEETEDDMFTDEDRAMLAQLVRTDDPTGRGTGGSLYERVCYLGQKTDELTRSDDPTGRGVEGTMRERVAYLGQKTDRIIEALERIDKRLDALAGERS